MRALDIPKYSAVGLLECLWHLTAKEAPSGDIGKLDNEDIALQLDWRGDPDTLIDALIQSRWLDEHPTARLVIHDWAEHREDAVDNWLARSGHRYVDGSTPRMNRLTIKERKVLTKQHFSNAQEAHAERTRSALPLPLPCPAIATPEPGQSRARPQPGPEPAPGAEPEPLQNRAVREGLGRITGTTLPLAAEGGGARAPTSRYRLPREVLEEIGRPEYQHGRPKEVSDGDTGTSHVDQRTTRPNGAGETGHDERKRG